MASLSLSKRSLKAFNAALKRLTFSTPFYYFKGDKMSVPLIEGKEDPITRKENNSSLISHHDVVDRRKKKKKTYTVIIHLVAEAICLGRENRGESYSTFPTRFRVL